MGSPSATASYYHADGLGSVLALTNVTAAVTATQRFDAFGQKLAGTGTVPQYGYTGREPDATGLIYYRARYYDPSVGRFTARDPVGYLDGFNRYAYVGNNPVNFTDPLGLTAQGPLGIQFASQNSSYYSGGQGVLDPAGNGYRYGYGPVPFASGNVPSGPPVNLAGGITQTANPFAGSTFIGEPYQVAVNTHTPGCPPGVGGCLSEGGGNGGFGGIGGSGAARALSGRPAEGAVSNSLGIPRNVGPGRETIPGSGPGGYRVPDFPPSVTIQQRGSIIEVKDTQSLSITPQLRDLGEHAERNNLIIELYTNARLPQSGELHRLIDRGVIIPKPIPSK